VVWLYKHYVQEACSAGDKDIQVCCAGGLAMQECCAGDRQCTKALYVVVFSGSYIHMYILVYIDTYICTFLYAS
jgi:hypothetical protein